MTFLRPVTERRIHRFRQRPSCLRARPCGLEILEERLLLSYSFVDLGNLGGDETIAYALNDSGQVVGHSTTIDRQTRAFLYDSGTLTEVNIRPQFASDAFGINASGQVVGAIALAGTYHGFLYDAGSLTDLGTLGGRDSAATAINDSGEIVGRASTTLGSIVQHAFSYSDGRMTDLGTLGGTLSAANAINASGWITGDAPVPAYISLGLRQSITRDKSPGGDLIQPGTSMPSC
jgi:probable HAF family extracellular repeat protein